MTGAVAKRAQLHCSLLPYYRDAALHHCLAQGRGGRGKGSPSEAAIQVEEGRTCQASCTLAHPLSRTRCTGRTSLAVLLAYISCRLWGTQKSHFGLLRLLAHEPSILLSKASTNTLGVLQELLCAMRHAFGLFGRNGARRKVVDTATEAALHQTRVQTHKVLELLLLNEALHLQLFRGRESRNWCELRHTNGP